MNRGTWKKNSGFHMDKRAGPVAKKLNVKIMSGSVLR
jgi:hypothetical protein